MKVSRKTFNILVGIVVVLGVLWLVWAVWPAAPKPPIPDQKYLDAHVHTAGLGYGDSGIFISDELRDNFRLPFYLSAFGVSMEELEEHGDRLVLERISAQIEQSEYVGEAVILALDGVVNSQGELDRETTEVYVPNDFLIRELGAFDNLLFGASINPYRKDSLERLDKVYQHGAVFIKWLPNIMLIDPADPVIIPFYRRMKALGLPLLTHTGAEHSFTVSDDNLGDPERLRLPLELGLTVIAAHVATTGESEGEPHFLRIQPMFDEFPNLYADISSLTQINKRGYLKRILENGKHLDRMIYGTDWPLQSFPLVSPYYHLDVIGLGGAKLVSSFENEWDRDVVLKKEIGVPEQIFRASEILVGSSPSTTLSEERKEQREEDHEGDQYIDDDV